MRKVRITAKMLEKARSTFEEHESRDLFYRVARELVRLALSKQTNLGLSEALAVLLQTWNKAYYQYHKFDAHHFAALEATLKTRRRKLVRLRERSLLDLNNRQELGVKALFDEFEQILGPVGAAKSLHLLAPELFPLWDRKIAKVYKIPLRHAGTNAERYWEFMHGTREQWLALGPSYRSKRDVLKRIDEYNYSAFTKGWLKEPEPEKA